VSHRLKVSTPRKGPLTVTRRGTGCERAAEAHRRWDTSPVSPRLVFTIPASGLSTGTRRPDQNELL